MEFKDKLRTQRRQLHLTQAELAARVGVSKITVARWESGAIGNLKQDKLLKLAQALELPVDYLLGSSAPQVSDLTEEALDELLVQRLCALTEEELAKVDAFVQGLLASR